MINTQRLEVAGAHRGDKFRPVHAISDWTAHRIRHGQHPIDLAALTGQQAAHFLRPIGQDVRQHLIEHVLRKKENRPALLHAAIIQFVTLKVQVTGLTFFSFDF